MASLFLRNLSEEVVRELRLRAAQHGRSVEAEHRAILEAALTTRPRRRLVDVLAGSPLAELDARSLRARKPSAAL